MPDLTPAETLRRPDLGDWVRVPRGVRDRIAAAQTPNLRIYQRGLSDGHLMVMVGAELQPAGPRWHMSISHRTNAHPPRPGRYPTWDEIKDARYRFMPGDITVAQLLPPESEWVNVMGTCFHLWEIREEVDA